MSPRPKFTFDVCVCRYSTLLVFALYSFWIPQIVLSVVTDARQGLKPAYVAGMSVLRLALPLYVWACPRNLLKVPPSYGAAAGLVAFVGIQARAAYFNTSAPLYCPAGVH